MRDKRNFFTPITPVLKGLHKLGPVSRKGVVLFLRKYLTKTYAFWTQQKKKN